MTLKTSDGSVVPNKLVLGIQRCIVETFDEAKWTELGYATDTSEIIDRTHRLRRSLAWGDGDCPERVFTAIRRMIERPDPSILDEFIEFLDLRARLAVNEPEIHADLFGDLTTENLAEITTSSHVDSVPELMRHARRIRGGLESDPEQAIGSAKELIETVMKAVLDDPDSRDDVPKLVKRTRSKLGLDVSDAIPKRMVSNLSQLVVGIAELRNSVGTGHGRAGSQEPDAPIARLAVDSAIALSRFFLELNEEI